jgi:hypothetical protein
VPDNVNQGVAGLKASLGLPTQGVNQNAGNPPVPAAPKPNVPPSPAQQQAKANEILANVGTQQVPADQSANVMAAKDKAIDDLRTQNQQLADAMNKQTEQMAQLLERTAPPATGNQAPQIPVPEMPALPDNIDQLPAEEVLKIVAENQKATQAAVRDFIVEDRKAWLNMVGPLVQGVNESREHKAKQEVEAAYPKFNWDQHRQDVQAKMAEVGNLKPIEAAQLVAMEKDPSLLDQPDVAPPVSMPTVPSAPSTGAPPQANDQEFFQRQHALRDASIQQRQQGNSTTANSLFDQWLAGKVLGKRPT